MKKYLPHLFFTMLALAIGYISNIIQGVSMAEWYPTIAKAPLTPPGIVFAIVWPVLYILMGISAGIMWNKRSIYTWLVLLLYLLQLGLNLAWSFCFFTLQSPVSGLVVLSLLIVAVVMYATMAYHMKKSAGIMNVPYILWLLFALYMNAYVVLYN